MRELRNDKIAILVSDHGAELQSIRRLSDNQELLWQADPKYWNRHSPILFPLVGHAFNDEIHIGEKTYPMGQHGIARDLDFTFVEHETRPMLTFVLRSNDSTFRRFPIPFFLWVRYTLEDTRVVVTWHIETSQRLPFQIGAHPAFNLPDYSDDDPIHGYLRFDCDDRLVSAGLFPGGYVDTEHTFDVPLDGNTLALTPHTFDCDTIIDLRRKVHAVTLADKQGRDLLTVHFSMPVLALWSPNGGQAPFVCIEPWDGLPDTKDYTGEFSKRPYTREATYTEPVTISYAIEVK